MENFKWGPNSFPGLPKSPLGAPLRPLRQPRHSQPPREARKCVRAAADRRPAGGAPVAQLTLFDPQPPSPRTLKQDPLLPAPPRFHPYKANPHARPTGSADLGLGGGWGLGLGLGGWVLLGSTGLVLPATAQNPARLVPPLEKLQLPRNSDFAPPNRQLETAELGSKTKW